VVLAGVFYLGAFLLVWAPAGWPPGPSWWGLAAPLAFWVGLRYRKAGLLALGVLFLALIAGAVALRGGVLPGAGALALGLAGWDVALLALRLPKDGETRRRLLRAQVVRALGVAALGMATAAGFSYLRLGVPFWGLMGMLVAAWAAVIGLFKLSARVYSAGGSASGNRSSSRPME